MVLTQTTSLLNHFKPLLCYANSKTPRDSKTVKTREVELRRYMANITDNNRNKRRHRDLETDRNTKGKRDCETERDRVRR